MHLRADRSQVPEALAQIHTNLRLTAVFPFKENRVARCPGSRVVHQLNPFSVEPGYRNGGRDYAIFTERNQPGNFGRERSLRLISRPLETQSPTSPGRGFYLIDLVL
jgi:hypothetical protein